MLEWSVTVEGETDLDRMWSARIIPTLVDGCREGIEDGMRDAVAASQASHTYQDRTQGNDDKYGKGPGLTRSAYSSVHFVGSDGAEGEFGWLAPYARFVEEGTLPHVIEAKGRDGGGANALAFLWHGVPVFFRKVHHPGTKPYPFAGPAVLKVLWVAEARIGQSVDKAARILWEVN